jgi:hypothetical protein
MSLGAGAIAGMVVGALIVLLGGAYVLYYYHEQHIAHTKVSPPEDTVGLASVVPEKTRNVEEQDGSAFR